MKTALLQKLKEDDKDRLLAFILQRVQQVHSDMHWWREELDEYERQADNDFQSRLSGNVAAEDKTIFDLKNYSLNLVRGVARFMKGRCEGDLFGGSPWFNSKAEGLADDDEADGVQKHFDFKLRQANYRKSGKEAIGRSIDLGTAVQKTTWKIVNEPFYRLGNVLVGSDDEPVLEPSPDDPNAGDMVEEGHPMLDPDETGNGASYQPPPDETGALPPIMRGKMQKRLIQEPNVKFKGLNTETISHRNLLAPMDVAKLEDADLLGHFYDMPFLDLKAHFAPDVDLGNGEASDDPDVSMWQTLQGFNNAPRTGDRQPKEGEAQLTNSELDEKNPWLQIHELRLRFAADGVNLARLYVVIHIESQSIIYADYLGNVTPAGDLDMHAVVINKVPGRWYGRGYFKVYRMLQELIDRALNMIEYHNGFNSNPILLLNKRVAQETMVDGKISLYPGAIFTKNGQVGDNEKLLELINLPDLDERTDKLMELYMQILQQDSGVTAAAQGDPGALPSVSTATGTQAILSSGSTMHQLVIDELREGLEPNLTYNMRLLYARQDKDETYSYMQGDKSTQAILSLATVQRLQKLYMQVSLSMTRIRNEELFKSATTAINSFTSYFTLVPAVQIALRPLYIQAAKGLELENTDTMFPLPQLPPPVVPGAPGAPGAPDPNAPVAPGAVAPAPGAPPPAVPPAAPAGGSPLVPNILTTGAMPAQGIQPLPGNVVPATPQPNQGGLA